MMNTKMTIVPIVPMMKTKTMNVPSPKKISVAVAMTRSPTMTSYPFSRSPALFIRTIHTASVAYASVVNNSTEPKLINIIRIMIHTLKVGGEEPTNESSHSRSSSSLTINSIQLRQVNLHLPLLLGRQHQPLLLPEQRPKLKCFDKFKIQPVIHIGFRCETVVLNTTSLISFWFDWHPEFLNAWFQKG